MKRNGEGAAIRFGLRGRVALAGVALRASLVLGLVLAGQAATTRAAASHAPQSGGTIVYGITQNIDSFVPVVSPTSILDDEAQVLLYRPLFYIGRTVSIDYGESIGTKVTASANNTTFTVDMRGTYKWSDGTPVTAADVAYCFTLIKQYGTRYGYYGIGGLPTLVKSFTVDSPTRFTIALTKSINPTYFLLNGLAQLRPLPSKAWSRYSVDYLFNHQTDLSLLDVVDGPFKLTKFVLNQQARFDRNPMYSGHKAYLDTFIIQYMASEQAEFAALKTGAIQIGHLGFTLYNQQAQLSGLKTFEYSIFGFSYITLNFRNPNTAFFKDVKVRQALQMAINQPEMNQSVYYGKAHNAYSPVPYVPGTYLSPAARSAASSSHFDLAKAKALLLSDGWKMGGDKVLAKGGKKLAFTLTVGSESQTNLRQAEILQQDMASIGVQLSLTITPFSVILPLLGGKGTNWTRSTSAGSITRTSTRSAMASLVPRAAPTSAASAIPASMPRSPSRRPCPALRASTTTGTSPRGWCPRCSWTTPKRSSSTSPRCMESSRTSIPSMPTPPRTSGSPSSPAYPFQ